MSASAPLWHGSEVRARGRPALRPTHLETHKSQRVCRASRRELRWGWLGRWSLDPLYGEKNASRYSSRKGQELILVILLRGQLNHSKGVAWPPEPSGVTKWHGHLPPNNKRWYKHFLVPKAPFLKGSRRVWRAERIFPKDRVPFRRLV